MKKLEFETSKGKFVLVDNNQNDKDVIEFLKSINYSSYVQRIKLSEITEEQSSEIVDKVMNEQHFQNYNFKSYDDRWVKTAIESLHSLLKSKDIHLFENPYPDAGLIPSYEQKLYRDAKEKTFYNPYIFKL